MSTIIDFVLSGGSTICRAAVPSSAFSGLYDALVCGSDLPSGRERALFLDTGLIHIMVVSGAHLVFVEQLCSWMPVRVRLGVLGAYAWFTGWGIPVVRAFVRRGCALVVVPWGWSPLQVELLASAVVLCAVPWWIGSRSFLMSWMCAVALCAPGVFVRRASALNASLKCFVLLFPFVPSSPVSVLWNSLLGPVVGVVLFPLCLAAFVVPWVVPLVDRVWGVLLWLLEAGPRAPAGDAWVAVKWVWWVPLGVHLLLLIGECRWRRASAFSAS